MMHRKTMRVGDVRTSIKLEKEFLDYLKEIAREREVRLSRLVTQVAEATPDHTNLASELRLSALRHAIAAKNECEDQLRRYRPGNGLGLNEVIMAAPNPCLLVDSGGVIRLANRQYYQWLGLVPDSVIDRRLNSVMLLHPQKNGGNPDVVQVILTAGYISLLRREVLSATAVVWHLGPEVGRIVVFTLPPS